MRSFLRRFVAAVSAILIAAVSMGSVSADIDPKNRRASFSSIEYAYPGGVSITLEIKDNKIVATSTDPNVEIDLAVAEYSSTDAARIAMDFGTVTIDCAGLMDVHDVWYIDMICDLGYLYISDVSPTFSKDRGGRLYFLEPPAYENNREKLKKLESFGDPYKSFLGKQTDIEIDNPDVAEFALDLCKGLDDDLSKVMMIYSLIVNEFVYDNTQVATENRIVLEDDVLTLLRSKLTICEGFANVFVALCRANGIPATEIYGTSYEYEEIWDVNFDNLEYSNHAWVAVYIDGRWYMADPTWDNHSSYDGQDSFIFEGSMDYFLLPVEAFSYSHYVMNADFSHTLAKKGKCGESATYEITRDGVCRISGEGDIDMPADADDFFEVVFDEGSNITGLAADCFVDCDQLRNIILPDSLTYIGEAAFCSCEDLEYVKIPDSVMNIEREAFSYCDKLAYVSIPETCSVSDRAFEGCPRLILEASSGQVDTSGYTNPIGKYRVRE